MKELNQFLFIKDLETNQRTRMIQTKKHQMKKSFNYFNFIHGKLSKIKLVFTKKRHDEFIKECIFNGYKNIWNIPRSLFDLNFILRYVKSDKPCEDILHFVLNVGYLNKDIADILFDRIINCEHKNCNLLISFIYLFENHPNVEQLKLLFSKEKILLLICLFVEYDKNNIFIMNKHRYKTLNKLYFV